MRKNYTIITLYVGVLLLIISQSNVWQSSQELNYSTTVKKCTLDSDFVENQNVRVKRQQSNYNVQDGNNFIDSIFQIPISTLTAVGSLIKNTRPIVMRARERIQQQYQQYQNQAQAASSSLTSQSRPSRGSNYYSSTSNKRKGSKKRRNSIQGRDYPNF